MVTIARGVVSHPVRGGFAKHLKRAFFRVSCGRWHYDTTAPALCYFWACFGRLRGVFLLAVVGG